MQTDPSLNGRAVVLDIILPLKDGDASTHRLLGIYAPWDPGTDSDDLRSFWDAVTALSRQARNSWSLLGDLNTTLYSDESTSSLHHYAHSRHLYTKFLSTSDSVDLWGAQHPNSLDECYTYHGYQAQLNTHPAGSYTHQPRAIIDRVAVSRLGSVAASISTISNHFIPCTDHRPVLVTFIPTNPTSLNHPIAPPEIDASEYAPRFRYPRKTDAPEAFKEFSSITEDLTKASQVIPQSQSIKNENDFEQCYHEISRIIREAAENVFQKPAGKTPYSSKPFNPTIRTILREIKRINRLISAVNRSPYSHTFRISFPNEPWVPIYLTAPIFSTSPLGSTKAQLLDYLRGLRRELNKLKFSEEREELKASARNRSWGQIKGVLNGASAKILLSSTLSSLPLAITPNPENPSHLLTGIEPIKNSTVAYFENLYRRAPHPTPQKTWMSSQSILEIKQRVVDHPFQWPVILSLHDFRHLLTKGNARPCPGPDGWEKWMIRRLPDIAARVILNLLNYIISTSSMPMCLKPTNESPAVTPFIIGHNSG